MDDQTFAALKRIMELIRPRASMSMELGDDWQRVATWMQEEAKQIDDLDTLGTDDPRRGLREVR